MVPEIVGIDSDAASITAARADPDAGDIRYIEADVLTYGFELATFDLVAAVASLHHMDAETALHRLRALLRPGGLLAVIGLARSSPGDLPIDIAAIVPNRIRRLRVPYWQHPSPTVWPLRRVTPQCGRSSRAIASAGEELTLRSWAASAVFSQSIAQPSDDDARQLELGLVRCLVGSVCARPSMLGRCGRARHDRGGAIPRAGPRGDQGAVGAHLGGAWALVPPHAPSASRSWSRSAKLEDDRVLRGGVGARRPGAPRRVELGGRRLSVRPQRRRRRLSVIAVDRRGTWSTPTTSTCLIASPGWGRSTTTPGSMGSAALRGALTQLVVSLLVRRGYHELRHGIASGAGDPRVVRQLDRFPTTHEQPAAVLGAEAS